MKIYPNTKLVQYVVEKLSRELKEVTQRNIREEEKLLSFEEQTLIYKYTEDGYDGLNTRLRANTGVNDSEFGKYLDRTLSKLHNYEGIVHRAVNLTNAELQKYKDAKENSGILVEYSFISTSKSKFIAYQFGKSCRFRIFSKHGKDIEDFAKYGSAHPQNEKEVLFRPNTRFRVLDITIEKDYTLITLEEVNR